MNICTEPKIRVAGGSVVSIDPIRSIADLAVISRKFGRIVEADPAGTAMKLTTCVGDLVASIQMGQDTNEDFAEEVADTLLAVFVVAANRGIGADEISVALRNRIGEQTNKAINESVQRMLAERGLNTENLQ